MLPRKHTRETVTRKDSIAQRKTDWPHLYDGTIAHKLLHSTDGSGTITTRLVISETISDTRSILRSRRMANELGHEVCKRLPYKIIVSAHLDQRCKIDTDVPTQRQHRQERLHDFALRASHTQTHTGPRANETKGDTHREGHQQPALPSRLLGVCSSRRG